MAAWGCLEDGVSRTLDTHIYRLRRKLQFTRKSGGILGSAYTHGYRLGEFIVNDSVVAEPRSEPVDCSAHQNGQVDDEFNNEWMHPTANFMTYPF
nr:helix-turn-helix domain-containing protein [Paraburkholderia lacunae]